jgi:hypothetical protein
MARRLQRVFVSFALAVIVLAGARLDADDKAPKDPALQAIIQRLARQENLIKSCECLLTHRTDVTDPKMIPRIEDRLHGSPRPGQYIIDEQLAAMHTYVVHWRRKGIKERADQYPTLEEMSRPGSTPTRVEATDGQLTRGYNKLRIPDPETGAKISGSIHPATWFTRFDLPFAFLYEYGHTRYSDLVARSPDAKVAEEKGRTTVSFSHPTLKDQRFVLIFDRDGSLLQRDDYARYDRDPTPRLGTREKFSGYRTYRSSAGESIWFPSAVDYEFSLGTSYDGKLIIYEHVHIDVNSFQFNHEIPDEIFHIHFPDGCPVYDAINRVRLPQGP